MEFTIRKLIVVLLIVSFERGFSQKQGNIWYFGNQVGFDFSNGDPTILNDGQIKTDEGVATICDKNGKLLFYTDGISVWNRNHTVMPNGTALNGDISSTQSAIIVPFINDPNKYYVFTVDLPAKVGGLCYSVVNFLLDNGLGDVETKNVQIQSSVCEKVTAVRHCNGRDIWIITHAWLSDAYYAYLVTSSGISSPVISHTGKNITGQTDRAIGYLKASPDGSKLAAAHNFISVDVSDFNNQTGVVTNSVSLDAGSQPYGVEFSPDSKLLYVTSFYYDLNVNSDMNELMQFDVNTSNVSQIQASKVSLNRTGYVFQAFGALQLAPNGKIYMAQLGQKISVINNPNIRGSACGLSFETIQFTRQNQQSRYGLPSFIQSFYQASFEYTGACSGQLINFNYQLPSNITSVKWDFGDPASGAGNNSTLSNPSHSFSQEGIYDVKLIRYHACGSDTLNKRVQAGALNFSLGSDTTICGNSPYTLDPGQSGSYQYLWQDSSTENVYRPDRNGIYWVEIKNTATGCHKRDSINLVFQSPPQFELGNEIIKCEGQTSALLVNIPSATFLWNTGQTSNSFIVANSGVYWLEVTLNGCTKRDSIQAIFYPYPIVDLGRDTTLCESDTVLLDAGNTDNEYLWQDASTQQTYIVSKKGTYHVKVTNHGCANSDTVYINYNYKPSFSLGPDLKICSGQTIFVKPKMEDSTNVNYLWQDGSNVHSYSINNPGHYVLQLSNNCGNQTDSINVTKGVCRLYVPTAFTPNGDGLNDVFRASQGENITRFKMEIFNRWGQRVFETSDMRKGWDGRYMQKMLPGVFIWIIKYDTIENKNQILKGTVTLVK